jgi:hypothetical protein
MKPSCFSKRAKKKEVHICFRNTTPAAVLFDVIGKSGGSVTRREGPPKDSPDEGLNPWNHIFRFPDLHKDFLYLFTNRGWGWHTIILKFLQTDFISSFGGTFSIWSKFPTENILFIDGQNGRGEDVVRCSLSKEGSNKVTVPAFLIRRPEILRRSWILESWLL